jgi:hypothetical protein
MANWGIWDIAGLFITIFPVIFLIIYLFPRRQIKNLYIDTSLGSINNRYSKVVFIELRNHTNTPIYLLSEGFKFGPTIKSSPFGAKNANTDVYEVKFEGRERGMLTEIDTLIRPNQKISTWIPVHNDESSDNVKRAIESKSVGILMFKALKIQTGRDAFVPLKIKI